METVTLVFDRSPDAPWITRWVAWILGSKFSEVGLRLDTRSKVFGNVNGVYALIDGDGMEFPEADVVTISVPDGASDLIELWARRFVGKSHGKLDWVRFLWRVLQEKPFDLEGSAALVSSEVVAVILAGAGIMKSLPARSTTATELYYASLAWNDACEVKL